MPNTGNVIYDSSCKDW